MTLKCQAALLLILVIINGSSSSNVNGRKSEICSRNAGIEAFCTCHISKYQCIRIGPWKALLLNIELSLVNCHAKWVRNTTLIFRILLKLILKCLILYIGIFYCGMCKMLYTCFAVICFTLFAVSAPTSAAIDYN